MAATGDDASSDIIKALSAIDRLAEEILIDKHEIVDLDRKRHKCREAWRKLKEQPENSKTWLCFGNTFIKMDNKKCIEILETDRRTIDTEINKLQDGLKPKVTQLHKMEGRPEVKGFELAGMKKEELLLSN